MDYHKCRLPIPSQETVKDALKKLMEDREKEKGDGEPTPPKDSKDTKEMRKSTLEGCDNSIDDSRTLKIFNPFHILFPLYPCPCLPFSVGSFVVN